MTCRSVCLVQVGCMRGMKQYDLRCLCGVRCMKHYVLRYLCRTSDVSVRYNWGCMRGMEQYMLRSLPGITGDA